MPAKRALLLWHALPTTWAGHHTRMQRSFSLGISTCRTLHCVSGFLRPNTTKTSEKVKDITIEFAYTEDPIQEAYSFFVMRDANHIASGFYGRWHVWTTEPYPQFKRFNSSKQKVTLSISSVHPQRRTWNTRGPTWSLVTYHRRTIACAHGQMVD